MSAIKKFTDFCGGFALFSAIIYLFCQFMAFDPKTEEELSTLGKLKVFFSPQAPRDYYLYLLLLALLVLSLTASLILRKHPQFAFALSTLPLIWIMILFDSERLYERPLLYIILCSIHSMGLLYECIRMDREDRRRRSAFATDLMGMIGALACILLILRAKALEGAEYADLRFFDLKIYFNLEDADLMIFLRPAVAIAITVLARLIWRDLYYLDAILAVVPAVYSIWLWNTERFPFHGILPVTVTVIYALARIAVMLSCRPKCNTIPTES